jgi:CRP/FNR family cyclic AMP-dependent transcriptional regulator
MILHRAAAIQGNSTVNRAPCPPSPRPIRKAQDECLAILISVPALAHIAVNIDEARKPRATTEGQIDADQLCPPPNIIFKNTEEAAAQSCEMERTMKKVAQDDFNPQAFLAKVGEGRTMLTFRKNETVFSQGDAADAVFYIQKGSVKIVVLSEQGKEAVVGILEPGQFFGEGCLNDDPLRISTTTALEECVLTAITKSAMLAALRGNPQFSELFMSYLLKRNRRIEEDLTDQLFNSSEKRLARLLLLLANFGKDGSQQPIKVRVNQETLAEMIGTTRSRVSFFMNKFRKLGLISYNGEIEVHNSLLNAVLHEKPQIQSN